MHSTISHDIAATEGWACRWKSQLCRSHRFRRSLCSSYYRRTWSERSNRWVVMFYTCIMYIVHLVLFLHSLTGFGNLTGISLYRDIQSRLFRILSRWFLCFLALRIPRYSMLPQSCLWALCRMTSMGEWLQVLHRFLTLPVCRNLGNKYAHIHCGCFQNRSLVYGLPFATHMQLPVWGLWRRSCMTELHRQLVQVACRFQSVPEILLLLRFNLLFVRLTTGCHLRSWHFKELKPPCHVLWFTQW